MFKKQAAFLRREQKMSHDWILNIVLEIVDDAQKLLD